MVLKIKKSNSLPILFDKAISNDAFEIDKTNVIAESNAKCKHNSLRRNDSRLRIHSKLLYENNELSNSKSCLKKLKVSECGLDSLPSSLRHLDSSRKPKQTQLHASISKKLKENSANYLASSLSCNINNQTEPVSLANGSKKNLKNIFKEPVRVIKITEIIEINDNDSSESKGMTQHELLNKYCFKDNYHNKNTSETFLNYAKIPADSTTSDSNDSDCYLNENRDQNRSPIKMTQSFISVKSPSISRKVDTNSLRKQHQIHSTTHVKTFDHSNRNHAFKEQKESNNKNEKVSDEILMEVFKLTNQSLQSLDLNRNKFQLSKTSTMNSLKRQPKVEFCAETKEIPVVHNFSFVNNDEQFDLHESDSKPKRIIVKITGRTRSVSTDKNNLINRSCNLGNLGSYRLDEVYSQQDESSSRQESTRQPFEFKTINNRIYETTKPYTPNRTVSINSFCNKEVENVIPITPKKLLVNNQPEDADSAKFNLGKFKSYLATSSPINNRSFSMPPNQIQVNSNGESQLNRLRSTPVKSSPAKNILNNNYLLGSSRNESAFNGFDQKNQWLDDLGSVKPFRSDYHVSLIKNADEIIHNKGCSLVETNKKTNDLISPNESTTPIWAFRDDSNEFQNENTLKKPIQSRLTTSNLTSFSCGLLNSRPKNMNSSFGENFNLSYLDYSPSFYTNNNKSSTNQLFEFNKKLESIDSSKNFLHDSSINIQDDCKIFKEPYNSYGNTLSLPNRHQKSIKKAASYYNEYYRDISNKKNFYANKSMKNDNENENCATFEKISAKYIDDEDDASIIMNDSNDEKFREVLAKKDKKTNEVTSDESIYSVSAIPKYLQNSSNIKNNAIRSIDQSLTNSDSPRTPKLSRRVIFADEC